MLLKVLTQEGESCKINLYLLAQVSLQALKRPRGPYTFDLCSMKAHSSSPGGVVCLLRLLGRFGRNIIY